MSTNKYSEYILLQELAEFHTEAIAQRVVKRLQTVRSGLLSGDDSGLENCWEEICAQVQHEPSVYWDEYAETIRQAITEEKESEPMAVKNLLSYIVDTGREVDYTSNTDIAAKPIYAKVMAMADSFTNKNISSYLEIRS